MNISLKSSMTEGLITIESAETVEKALMVMKSHYFRHLPVVSDEKKIIGFVSDRDLYKGLSNDYRTVAQVMRKDFFTVDLKSDIREIVRLMIKNKISALLVKDKEEIIGIITSEDLLHILLNLLDQNTNNPTYLEELVKSLQEIAGSFNNPNLVTSF